MVIKLEILRTSEKGVTWEEALKIVKESGKRMPTNKEIDDVLQSRETEKYTALFPCWTGTYVEYEGEDCIVTENGKKTKIKLPLESGWYAQDKFGLPSGETSKEGDPKARYFWRLKKHSGSVARGFGNYLYLRRDVGLGAYPSVRFGVAVVKEDNKNN